MRISVVIPVYGCKDALPELHERLTQSLVSITDDYEIILVNDNCPQDSWTVIEGICSKDNHVKGVELSRNFGQMKAILAGLDMVSGDWIVVMDCDLQDRPEEIPHLYNKALEGYDAVFARRKERKDGFVKVLLSRAFYKIYSIASDGNYDGSLCNFSIVKRCVIDNYCKMREIHRGYVMYIRWLGYKHAVIEVTHDERHSGESSYTLRKRMDYAWDLILSQSDKILHLFAKLGLVIDVIAFFIFIGLIIYKIVGDVTIGWTSTLVAIMFMGGLILSALGIVGIYVGKTFMQTKNRPLYVVRQVIDNENKSATEGNHHG